MHKLGGQRIAKMCFNEKRKISVLTANSFKFPRANETKNRQISPFFGPIRALLLKRNSAEKQSKRRFDERENTLKHRFSNPSKYKCPAT